MASVLVDNSSTSTTNNIQSVYNQQTSVCILICPWEAVKRRKRQSLLGENHQGRVLSKEVHEQKLEESEGVNHAMLQKKSEGKGHKVGISLPCLKW